MVSAPTTETEWAVFVGLVMALYAGILLMTTTTGLFAALAMGAFYGLFMAVIVAVLVVLWRGVPGLLYQQKGE